MKQYILSICAAAILSTIWTALVPEGAARKKVWYISSLILVLTVISPIISLNPSDLQSVTEKFSIETSAWREKAVQQNLEVTEKVISSRYREYIWKQAEPFHVSSLDIDLSFETSDGYPYPTHIIITGSCSPQAVLFLQEKIKNDLGIPMERQVWNIHDTN